MHWLIHKAIIISNTCNNGGPTSLLHVQRNYLADIGDKHVHIFCWLKSLSNGSFISADSCSDFVFIYFSITRETSIAPYPSCKIQNTSQCNISYNPYYLFVLYDLILYFPVNIFPVMWGCVFLG